ncbi:MAG: YIP1 family protein [Acidobacteria bacterium]|jgi:hypothetical protein|nr:YIP1 family protein [Acidobacteriota bacterium]
MAAAPLNPDSVPTPTPEPAGLSEGARILNTFVAPSKTFSDLRRSAAWWGPYLLMVIAALLFMYVAGAKVGFRKAMENQMQSQPKTQARLEQLPPEQREAQMEQGTKITKWIAYATPVLQLVILLIIATALWVSFKIAGTGVTFKISLAVVMYAGLPGILKMLLAIVALLAGANPDSFTLQNPVGTNLGYFLDPATTSPALRSLATSIDVFLIWTLVLSAIGFIYAGKVKSGTSYAVVFGWAFFFILAGAGIAAAFS